MIMKLYCVIVDMFLVDFHFSWLISLQFLYFKNFYKNKEQITKFQLPSLKTVAGNSTQILGTSEVQGLE